MPESPGQVSKINAPRPYTFTREQIVHALQMPPVTGTLCMIEEQGGGPEDLADAILESLEQLTGGAPC